jgi:NAD(P)-dependent dehydrogenase (short-subunit alcohol dehydrogenase family)
VLVRALLIIGSVIDLTGKTALVTGSNKGIGWAVARLFARQGARVAVNFPNDANYPHQLAELGPDALAVKADIGRLSEIETLFSEVKKAFGHLDILVNNAGIFPRAHVLELDEATWDAVHNVNLKGLFFCCQQAGRMMAERRSGHIVNISSGSALTPDPRGAHYAATKAGVIAVTKCVAAALAPYQVSVNAIGPGLTDTDQPRDGLTEDQLVEMGRLNPLGRMAQPEDIARAVLYLSSDLSEYVTGQTLFVNGGALMVP